MISTRGLSFCRIAAFGAMLSLFACSSPPLATPEVSQSAATALQTATVAAASPAEETKPQVLPLSLPGPYAVGWRSFSAKDATRADRLVGLTFWYPAKQPPNAASSGPVRDAAPDPSGAPYPLLVSSTKVAQILAPYLVTRGFVWVSVDGIDSYPKMSDQMFSQPLDLLFALDHVATHPPSGLEGTIDSEHAGVIGYSFDGYNSLALSGARIDPEHYLHQCPDPDPTVQPLLQGLSSFSCGPAAEWDAFSDRAGSRVTDGQQGLWRPMTDDRIRAVMPLACEGWWLFGQRGLAEVDRPVLMIDGSEDQLYAENALIFDHLGTADKGFISFVGQGHMMIYDRTMVARMAHFAAAFFGYHLKGEKESQRFFSEEYVSALDGLAWGVMPSR